MGLTVAEVLLLCPFCGKTDNLTVGETDKQDMWSVNCVGCDIEMVQIVNNRQEIVELWNKRVLLSPEKVVGMVEIDESKLIEFAQAHCRELYDAKGEADEYHEKFGALIYFSKAIVSNQSKILGVRK